MILQSIVLNQPNPEQQSINEGYENIRAKHYINEQTLSEFLINILRNQGYESLEIHDKTKLIDNLRSQLEKLNSRRNPSFKFTDLEWNSFFEEHLMDGANAGIENRNRLMQIGDCTVKFKRKSGEKCRIILFDKENPQFNHLQVASLHSRPKGIGKYNVIILVNGLPMVQINLTKGEVSIEGAYENLRDGEDDGLFEFIQIFAISNGIDTKYFSNAIKSKSRDGQIHIAESWGYADGGAPVKEIVDFAHTFLNKRTLLEILARYCVLDSSGNLKILRSYQVAAIERVLHHIRESISSNENNSGIGGYIWHANGTGKTLTSFKVTQLAFEIPEVKKVLFVIDKKDLNNQTYSQYKNFLGKVEDQAIDNTLDTKALKRVINDDTRRIIVTTTQKLSRLLSEDDATTEETKNSRIVIIADECHRNQTPRLKELINRNFDSKNWFGFTGTPLLKHQQDGHISDGTIEIFENLLHKYTLIDAIVGGTALPFHINHSYEKYTRDLKKIENIVRYIIETFEEITHRRKFNAIFAVGSVSAATKYYREFKRQQGESNAKNPLKIAMIFNPPSQKEYAQWNDKSDEASVSEALKEATDDYNRAFNCNVQDFYEYKDAVSESTKKKEIDILLVVNMFLEGLNAPTLNTLYVDKSLREHGLLQAFSRINRVLDSSKTFGNVILFRDIQKELHEAMLLFSLDPESIKTIVIPEEK